MIIKNNQKAYFDTFGFLFLKNPENCEIDRDRHYSTRPALQISKMGSWILRAQKRKKSLRFQISDGQPRILARPYKWNFPIRSFHLSTKKVSIFLFWSIGI